MSNKFIGRKDVDDTPFSILEFEGGKHIIALGNQRISAKTFNTYEQALKYVKFRPWELIINTACAAIHMYKDAEQKQKQEEQEDKKPGTE